MKGAKGTILFFFISIITAQGQTSFEQDAYLSNLNSFNFFNPDLAEIAQIPKAWDEQQLHFRWNGHLYLGNHFSAKMSVRNRMFTGDNWQDNLFGFREALDKDELGFTSIKSDKVGIHHQIDRLYTQWEKGNWNVRLGRQRINWGIQNYWNSHDLFNQVNFFDFDYIEKPGADALRIQYYTNTNSSIELAINKDICAGLYQFHFREYDFQTILAKYFDDISIGFGWAGQLNDAGFKGEFAYFENSKTDDNAFVGSISLDYSFESGTYISAGSLYRSQAEEFNPLAFYGMEISAKKPMPFEYSFLYQINYPIHPLVQIGTSIIHDHEIKFIFLNPQITFSLLESLDLLLSSQNMWMKINEEYEGVQQTVFTRLQWNL